MKSLIRTAARPGAASRRRPERPATTQNHAQCCAKISRNIAGCHD